MIYWTQIWEQIKELHKAIYKTEPIANVFLWGNAGMFAMAFAIDNLAQAISKKDDTDKELIETIIEEVKKLTQS